MTDIWTPGPPPAPTQPLPPGLPLANQWNQAAGCMPSGCSLSVVGNVILDCTEGASISYAANGNLVWSLALNDGSSPPNVALQQWAGGAVIATPITVSGVDGSTIFDAPVYLAEDPVDPLGAVTKQYVDAQVADAEGILDAPSDGNYYGRRNAAWSPVLPEAPIDGQVYGRQSLSWTPISASFLPLTGGTITGNLTVNGVMTVHGSNSFVLDGPAGGQRAFLSASGGAFRWQMQLADYTQETGNNTGSNFTLTAIGDTGAFLSTPLSINRATGAVTIAAATGTSPGAPTLILNKATVAPQGSLIQGQRNGLTRWQLNLANFNAELGGNLGSNFSIDRFDDTGAQLGVSPLLINRQTGLATFGYSVTVTATLTAVMAVVTQGVQLNGTPGNRWVGGTQSGGSTFRWAMEFGNATPESGSNAGSDFVLHAFSDAGAMLSPDPLTITRSNGRVTFGAMPSIPGGFLNYVLATNGAGVLTWTPPGGGGGGIADAPTDGAMYARFNATWEHITSADVTDLAATLAPYALTANVPGPSPTFPIMDGSANAGSSSFWSRGDHVHPSDTSRIPDAPANSQNYARNNNAWVQFQPFTDAPGDGQVYGRGQFAWRAIAAYTLPPATTTTLGGVKPDGATITAAVDGTITSHPIGENRIINGNFPINQRGYASGTALAAAVYGHDRWKAGAAGCTYSFTAALPDTIVTISAGTLTQVIEAGWIEGGVYTLSWTGTAQARVYQGAPAGAYAASPIVTASLPAGANTIVEFNTGTVVRAKLEIGSAATAFNRQSMAKIRDDCERYYRLFNDVYLSGYEVVGSSLTVPILFPTMRAAPTGAFALTYSSNAATYNIGLIHPNSCYLFGSPTAAGTFIVQGNITLNAEL